MLASTLASSDYVYPTVLPWRDIIDDIRGRGLSRKAIADLIGVPWTTLQRWHCDGVEPRDSDARAILVLHTRYCGFMLTQRRIGEAQPAR